MVADVLLMHQMDAKLTANPIRPPRKATICRHGGARTSLLPTTATVM
jgi:hypothetical protein